MWKWLDKSSPISGVPAQDYSDEDFAKVQLDYERGHFGVEGERILYAADDGPGALERSGLWQHFGPYSVEPSDAALREHVDELRRERSAQDPAEEGSGE